MRTQVLTLFTVSLLSCLCANAEDEDISRTNRSIHIGDGERVGDLHSVNGSIEIGDRAVAAIVKTVNGSVRIGTDGHAKSLGTVNGAVSVGKRSIVDNDMTSVNGRLTLSEEAVIQGNVKNINSRIVIGPRAHVGGKVISNNGDITLQENARVDGGIKVKAEPTHWFKSGVSTQRRPVITIGPGAQVEGEMVFERDVELRVHSTAKIGAVTGASVERY